MVRW